MPAYNTASYIDEAIHSVVAQTRRDFELIVVDDGSTDATRDVAVRWAARDPRVRVIAQPNRGIAAARNTAMRHASGAVFALLDSDDAWMPGFLAVQMRQLDLDATVGVVTGNAYYRGGPMDGRPMRPLVTTSRRLTLNDLIADESAVCIMALFRREVVDRVGMFDERLRMNEDYQFWLRAAHAGFAVVQTPQVLGYYRRHAASVSAQELRMLEGIMSVLRDVRVWCHDRPTERATIDAQLARLADRRDLTRGKAALLDGAFDEAAQAFSAVFQRNRSLRMGAVAAACRVLPRALRWTYRLRSASTGTAQLLNRRSAAAP
jgi:glycosyltransferase involved in cell wall biosynthesis